MNFGSWNAQMMVEKHGNLWKPFWKTFISLWIGLHYALLPISGASTMMYRLLRPLRLRLHRFWYFHIPNIPMYMSRNRLMLYLIKFIFSNLVGDAPPNIIHKEHLLPYPGHHGDLHHHPHHRNHFVDLCTLILLPHLRFIHMDRPYHKNLALWTCQIPAYDDSPQFANKMTIDLFCFILVRSPWCTVLISYFSSLFSFLIDYLAALALFCHLDAMAPSSSRPHPYRATSTVATHLKGLDLPHG